MTKYYIFAENARHADYYAKQIGLGGITRSNVIYVKGPEDLWGVRQESGVEFLFYETCGRHPRWIEIKEYVDIIESIGTWMPILRGEPEMEENKDSMWWRLVHLDPVLLRGAVIATVAMLASFGLILTPGIPDALVGFLGTLLLIGQALWTRPAVTPNAKVAVAVPDPVNAPHVVEAGEAKTTASNTEILEAAKS